MDYGTERILIVEDNRDFGQVLQKLLERLGFKSHYVPGSMEALDVLQKQEGFTFLVTDVKMPKMDGLELTRKVKINYTGISIIVMTGYTEKNTYMDVINAGATDFIKKPFQAEELEAKIARAIVERDIREKFEKLSITDALTGLYNHRHFYKKLKNEIVRAQRYKQQLGLILFDLNDFKQYNDTNGHLAGDELLRKTGKILTLQIREVIDSAYRYGGDEFAIIVGNAKSEICRAIAQRIVKVFSEECNSAGISFGWANFEEGMTAELLVAKADMHLYENKELRRIREGGCSSKAVTRIPDTQEVGDRD